MGKYAEIGSSVRRIEEGFLTASVRIWGLWAHYRDAQTLFVEMSQRRRMIRVMLGQRNGGIYMHQECLQM